MDISSELVLKRKKELDGKEIRANAVIEAGKWTLKKGSIIGIKEDVGVSGKAKAIRAQLMLSTDGVLQEDFELGLCTPSLAGVVVMNAAINGWQYWKNVKGESLDVYKK